MKKGIQKSIITIIAALLLVMPFSYSVSAESDINLGYLNSFFWWNANGFTNIQNETYTVSSHSIVVPQHYSFFQMGTGTGSNGFSGFVCQTNGASNPSYTCYLRGESGGTWSGSELVNSESAYTMTEQSYNITKSGTSFITKLSGSYTAPSAYDNNKRIWIEGGDIYDIFFMTSTSGAWQLNPSIYPYPGSTYTLTIVNQPVQVYGNYYLHHLTVTSDSTGNSYGTPSFPGLNGYSGEVIPIYMGNRKYMTNDMYSTLMGNPDTYGSLTEVNSVDAADDSNAALGTSVTNMTSVENGYNNDLNSQLNNIDFTDHITTQQGFLTSSAWVVSVFNLLIANNPFTWLIIIVCIFYVFRRFN